MEFKLKALAEELFSREQKRRPEAAWIQQKVDRLAAAEGICSKAEMDQLIYEKMYASAPGKTGTTKIRYWRTGHHLPGSREEALMFAEVLQMNQEEIVYFLQSCMEKSDVVFEKMPEQGEENYARYMERTALMEAMFSEYIASIPPAYMLQLDISYENLSTYARHLYCVDAFCATVHAENAHWKEAAKRHMSSSNYEAEFLRTRRLLGEIPRRAIIRQIFLLGNPYLNRRLIDERLTCFGYLPLTEGHTNPKGALVDDLIIGFLKLYEETCAGENPLVCRSWILEQLRNLDGYLVNCGKEEYRFWYFRSLSTMVDDEE